MVAPMKGRLWSSPTITRNPFGRRHFWGGDFVAASRTGVPMATSKQIARQMIADFGFIGFLRKD